MEYVRTCLDERSVIVKSRTCTIARIAAFLILTMLLAVLVASYSYAAETLTLDQAIDLALRNNPGLKAADAQVEAADAGRAARGNDERGQDLEQRACPQQAFHQPGAGFHQVLAVIQHQQ